MVASRDEDALGQEVAENAEGCGQTRAVKDAVGRCLLVKSVAKGEQSTGALRRNQRSATERCLHHDVMSCP